MSSYEATFEWPHLDCSEVKVTGTFDQWSSSIRLARNATGFTGTVQVPWGEKIAYKFVVDGQWLTHPGQQTERDPSGNLNNVVTVPPKPSAHAVDSVASTTVAPSAAATEVEPVKAVPEAIASKVELATAADSSPQKANFEPPLASNTTEGASIPALNVDSKATETPKVAVEALDSASDTKSGEATTPSNLAVSFDSSPKDTAPEDENSKTPASVISQIIAVPIVSEVIGKVRDNVVQPSIELVSNISPVSNGRKNETNAEQPAAAATEITDTVLAREGASSTLEYVVSGIGAAIHGVVGIDPINADKIEYHSPRPDAQFDQPEPEKSTAIIAPLIRIDIVPVNNAENNDKAPQVITSEEPSTHTPVSPKLSSPDVAPIEPASPKETHIADVPVTESSDDAVEKTVSPIVVPLSSSDAIAAANGGSIAPDQAQTSDNHIAPHEEKTPNSVDSDTASNVVSDKPVPASATKSIEDNEDAAIQTKDEISAPVGKDSIVASTNGVEQKDDGKVPTSAIPDVPASSAEINTAPIATPTPNEAPIKSTDSPADVTSVKSSPAPIVVPAASPAVPTPPANGGSVTPIRTPSPRINSRPSTPITEGKRMLSFPSSSPGIQSSPSSSKFGTASSRKKRTSIFGKIKNIFGSEKDKN